MRIAFNKLRPVFILLFLISVPGCGGCSKGGGGGSSDGEASSSSAVVDPTTTTTVTTTTTTTTTTTVTTTTTSTTLPGAPAAPTITSPVSNPYSSNVGTL